MKLPIKFVWGSPNILNARWHGGLFCRYKRIVQTDTDDNDSGGRRRVIRRLMISIRGLLLWTTALLVIGYFAAAMVFFQWMDSRPLNTITLQDCLLYPVRRDIIKVKQGQAFVREGLDDIKAGKVQPGMQKLAIGIQRYPQEMMGRLVLANIYVLMNAHKRAATMLRNGLPYSATDRRYMESVFQFAGAGEDYDLWQEACDAALAQSDKRPDLAAFRLWIIQNKITGLTDAGRPAEAVRLAEASGANTDESLGELNVLALLKNGDAKAAITFINTWQKRNKPSAPLSRLLIRALREAARYDDMEYVLTEWCHQDPTNPTPYINLVTNRVLIHNTDGAQAALKSFFTRFDSNLDNLVALSKELVPLGETALSKQCLAQAQDQGFPLFTLKQFLMETCITKGDFSEAQALLNQLVAQLPKNDPSSSYWQLMSLLIAATLDPTDGVQSNLTTSLQEQRMTLVAYRRLISVLRAAGRDNTALSIAQLAQRYYPDSTPIAQTYMSLAKAVEANKAAKPQLVIIKPKPSVVTDKKIETAARSTLAGVDDETLFFNRLNAQIKGNKTNDALTAIHTAKDARPEWLDTREDDLSLMEIPLYAKQDDPMTVKGLAHAFLNGSIAKSEKMLGLAKELHGGGDNESALLIVREIIRKTPNFRLAERALNEWAPAAAPATTAEP